MMHAKKRQKGLKDNSVSRDLDCYKCKKKMKDISHHMMGINKKCYECGIVWEKRLGFIENN